MKSYNHLYAQLISDDNIRLALKEAAKSGRHRAKIRKFSEDEAKAIETVRNWLVTYKQRPHTPIEINDGITKKKRQIFVPRFKEQIIHHALINVLKPISYRGMYEHSYASIPKRGAHKAKKYIKRWIANDPKHVKYVLKMDIRKFFDSVPHDILKAKLRKIIHDERFLSVLFEIIDVNEVGIPLGFYTSQWIANWYLQRLDHYIKEELHAFYYVRYMDDMVILGSNKRKLHHMREAIELYLQKELGLQMKQNWQVFRFDYYDRKRKRWCGRDLDFMGFRFFRDRIVLRRTIMLRATRKANRIGRKKKPTIFELRQFLSYMGWIKATDTYGMFQKWIKPKVDIKRAKRRISNYDRRRSEAERSKA